jgi:endonuclease/exonuclease/phosphatase (EEP) superfamily protein YafD
MRSGKTSRVITVVVVGYALGMALVAVAVAMAGDSNALGMLLLFGPRWLLVFPWALLVPLSLAARRWVTATAIVGSVVTLFQVSGFEIPSPNSLRSAMGSGAGAGKALRVVTYNTDRSAALAQRIDTDLLAWDADVIVMQDCAPEVAAAMRAAGTRYQLFRESEFCIASRLPMRSPVQLHGSRNQGRAVLFSVEWQGAPIRIGTVHLPSPRTALWAARRGSGDLLEESVQQRAVASGAIAAWMREGERGPIVVAGDFNLPVESQALRHDWRWLRNAFSEAGWGFGHTMFAGRHRVRIDHVLVSREFAVQGALVLSGFPSEHQPVVAELSLVP